MKFTLSFEQGIEDQVRPFRRLIVKCDGDENTFNWKDVLDYLNTPSSLSKIHDMFMGERNSAIWVYSKDGFVHEGNIASWEHLHVTMRQFGVIRKEWITRRIANIALVKGNKVKIAGSDFVWEIVKYPSNSEIHLWHETAKMIEIVNKEQITEKL